VLADVELAGVITDDDRLVQEAVSGHRAPQRALGGDSHRVGRPTSHFGLLRARRGAEMQGFAQANPIVVLKVGTS
jgi:hypothetical protein